MTIFRNIMVHLEGTAEDETRILHAEALSSRFDSARITGLYTNPLPEYAYVMGAQAGYGDIGPMIALEQQVRREGDRVVERLDARLMRSGGNEEVRRIDAWPSAIPDLAVSQARCADLFVATTPYRDPEGTVADRLTEAVLFEAGHGLFLVPPHCPVRRDLVNVLVAWTDTTPAIRAVTEALSFLTLETNVRLLSIDTSGGNAYAEQSADIAAHLCRHGLKVDVLAVKGEPHQVAYIICDEAAKLSADMVVMGGYGHSRFREWVLGGATRDVIQRMAVPLFVAH